MDPAIQATLNNGFLSAIPIVIKTVGPWLLVLFITGLAITFFKSKIEREEHEKTWKTKEVVNLLREIKENTRKKGN